MVSVDMESLLYTQSQVAMNSEELKVQTHIREELLRPCVTEALLAGDVCWKRKSHFSLG